MPAPPPRPPRIQPGGRREIGAVRLALMRLLARRFGGDVPNVMLVLARHRRLFVPWLWFASRLMPNGALPASDTELVILRVGFRCGCAYERAQHVPLARRAGLGERLVAWTETPVGETVVPPEGDGLDSGRAALLVRATDELLDTHDLADETWTELSRIYGERELVELPMLVGHYAMLAGTLNAVRTPLDAEVGKHRLR